MIGDEDYRQRVTTLKLTCLAFRSSNCSSGKSGHRSDVWFASHVSALSMSDSVSAKA